MLQLGWTKTCLDALDYYRLFHEYTHHWSKLEEEGYGVKEPSQTTVPALTVAAKESKAVAKDFIMIVVFGGGIKPLKKQEDRNEKLVFIGSDGSHSMGEK